VDLEEEMVEGTEVERVWVMAEESLEVAVAVGTVTAASGEAVGASVAAASVEAAASAQDLETAVGTVMVVGASERQWTQA
jgi:hypothetical protein